MTCGRCHGLLINVPPLAWSSLEYMPSELDEPAVEAWECVNCGEYVDKVILANRMTICSSGTTSREVPA